MKRFYRILVRTAGGITSLAAVLLAALLLRLTLFH